MKHLLAVCLLLLTAIAWSQEKRIGTGRFRAGLSTGILGGESDPALLFQITGGIERRYTYAGVGFGHDPYEFNSFPVFVELRRGILPKKTFFVYGNAGLNLPGHYKKEEEFLTASDRMKVGGYFEIGAGYRILTEGWHRFFISAGYSFKESEREIKFEGSCMGVFPCTDPPHIYNYRHRYGRIIVKIGWEFGKDVNF
jgi:hypothetical protein